MVEPATGTLTVLFTDLVGSTAARAALGEEVADATHRRHLRLLAETVLVHRGQVVKELGDGIMATFPSAVDGTSAAVTIQQRVAAAGGPGPVQQVRIGLSVGDVSMADGDCQGVPVVEAARPCERAAPGEVLCADLVRAMTRGRGGYDFESIGELELKGLPEPLEACRIAWTAAAGPIVFPAALERARAGFSFVGRSDERARLSSALDSARRGQRRAVLLAGEPGVGKTRLVAEAAHDAHDRGAIVLFGRCTEDLGVPYQPFVEALRNVVDLPSGGVADLLAPAVGELARILPELRDVAGAAGASSSVDPEVTRRRLFDAFTSWFDVLAERAAAVETRFGARPFLVLTQLEWAHALLARDGEGDRPRAWALREIALATAADMGMFVDDELAGRVTEDGAGPA